MARYGIGYKGSKSKIAEDILAELPSGKRLVDLFGGGFAITHCAMTKYAWKWNEFLWNDYNPLLKKLIEDAIAGKYSVERFRPEWISRERFFAGKEQDGYIKWCWSFGNGGQEYMFGRELEELKRRAFEYVVNGTKDELFDGIELPEADYQTRRKVFTAEVRKREKRIDLQSLESLQRLERLERLQSLQSLQSLELTCMDYREYKHKDGDVVYCDIPYSIDARPETYGDILDHEAFYKWAEKQDFPVYYSNYTHGQPVWSRCVTTSMGYTNNTKRTECLFRIGGE